MESDSGDDQRPKKKARPSDDPDDDDSMVFNVAGDDFFAVDPSAVPAPAPATQRKKKEKKKDKDFDAPGDDQSFSLDALNDMDIDHIEIDVQQLEQLSRTDPLIQMRSTIMHALLPGETLPLLKTNMNIALERVDDIETLAKMIVELATLSESRNNNFRYTSRSKKVKDAIRAINPDFVFQEESKDTEKSRLIQDNVTLPGRDDPALALMNEQRGAIGVFDPYLRLTDAGRQIVRAGMCKVLDAAFYASNPDFAHGYDSMRISTLFPAYASVEIFALLTQVVNALDISALQRIWADILANILPVDWQSVEDDDEVKTFIADVRRVNEAFGNRFPPYLNSTFAGLIGSASDFAFWRFQGNFASMYKIAETRRLLLAKLILFEEQALVPGIKLFDYQRTEVINMLVQECLSKEDVKEHQAGIRGSLLFADPGTGKTLIALVAIAFIDFLRPAKKTLVPKTLIVLPPTSLNSFQGDVSTYFTEKHRPNLFIYTKKNLELMNGKDYSSENIDDEEVDDPLTDPGEVDPLQDVKIKYVVITYKTLSELEKATDRIAKSILEMKWTRIIVDEAHKFTGRGSGRYLVLRHSLVHRSMFLLTGTPVQTRLADVMSQIRLLGYDSKLDKTPSIVDKHAANELAVIKEHEESLKKPIGEISKEVRDRLQKTKLVEEEKLISDDQSTAIIQSISRIERYMLTAALGDKATASLGSMEVHVLQSSGDMDKTTIKKYGLEDFIVYERVLEKLTGGDILPVNELMDSIREGDKETAVSVRTKVDLSLGATEASKENEIDADADATATAATTSRKRKKKSEQGASLKVFADTEPLYELLGEYRSVVGRMCNRRNHAVDIRALSKGQLSQVKAKFTQAVNAASDDEKVEIQRVRDLLNEFTPYKRRPTTGKADPNAIDYITDLCSNFDPETSPQKMKELLAWPFMQKRYVHIALQLDAHLKDPLQGKSIVFFEDPAVMLAFCAYLTVYGAAHMPSFKETTFWPLQRNLTKQEELVGKQKPGLSYVYYALFDSTKTAPQRSFILKQFKDVKSDFKIVLSTFEVAETGMNLQAANQIILGQQMAKDSTRIQSIARALRCGQTKRVKIIDIWSTLTGESTYRAIRLARKRIGLKFDKMLQDSKLVDERKLVQNATRADGYEVTLQQIDAQSYQRITIPKTAPARAPVAKPQPKKRKPAPAKPRPSSQPTPPTKRKRGPSPLEGFVITEYLINPDPKQEKEKKIVLQLSDSEEEIPVGKKRPPAKRAPVIELLDSSPPDQGEQERERERAEDAERIAKLKAEREREKKNERNERDRERRRKQKEEKEEKEAEEARQKEKEEKEREQEEARLKEKREKEREARRKEKENEEARRKEKEKENEAEEARQREKEKEREAEQARRREREKEKEKEKREREADEARRKKRQKEEEAEAERHQKRKQQEEMNKRGVAEIEKEGIFEVPSDDEEDSAKEVAEPDHSEMIKSAFGDLDQKFKKIFKFHALAANTFKQIAIDIDTLKEIGDTLHSGMNVSLFEKLLDKSIDAATFCSDDPEYTDSIKKGWVTAIDGLKHLKE